MKKSFSILCASLVLSLSGCQTLHSDNKTSTETTETAQSPLKDYRFENGLRLIVKEDRRSPIVMTQIWYEVGSIDEPVGKGGISHFLEHLMFKDSTLLSGEDFHRVLNHFGSSKNAFTSYDFTAYYESLPANQYPIALEIEAARMQNLILRDEEIETERQVIFEERRQRTDSNPLAKAYEEFFALAMPDSPRGRPIIGSMADIENISPSDLKAWYDTWYAPNNATLVMVGDISAADAYKWAKKYFGDATPKALPERTLPIQKSHRGYTAKETRQAVNVPTLIMGFNVPSLSSDNPKDALALSVFSDIADGGYSARFEQTLVREKALFDSIGASYNLLQKGDALFVIVATPKAGVTLEQAETEILNTLANISHGEIRDEELSRGQTNLAASLIFNNESIASTAQNLGVLSMLGLPLDTVENLPKTLSALKKSDIQAAGKHYLVRENLTRLSVLPQADSDTH
ncbi:MAG: pitrilysin family protein [Moraxella sp.]|nr:pitrilysin family protein [Moraxella sp.]